MRARFLLPIISIVSLGVVALHAQQPAPAEQTQPPLTFKAEVNYIEVDAIVTDQSGNFIRDLKQSDFQVLEDGKPQSVSVFSLVDIPIERADRPLYTDRPIEPDVLTNERINGRLYMLVLDDLHTAALRSARVRFAARRFIEQMAANDMAAVVMTSGRTDAAQELTTNKRLLLNAVDKFLGRKLRSSTLERIDQYNTTRETRQPRDPIRDPLDAERGYQARNTLGALKGVAEWMAGIRGRRKALVFISEGIDYDIHDVFNSSHASIVQDEVREAIAAATRNNVSIYAVDPRGLTSAGDDAAEIPGLPDDVSVNLGITSMNDELRLAQDSLRVLSDETGGFAAVNRNDFSEAFQRIVRDNSSYYVLGYYPVNERRDGKFRKIDVRVTRPGVTVRARKGYVAPRGRAPEAKPAAGPGGSSPELRAVLTNPIGVSGLPLAVTIAPFRGTGPDASLVLSIQIGGRALKFQEREGTFQDDLEVSIIALDQEGKMRGGDRQQLALKLRPETHEAVLRHGFRLLSRFDVPPGKYQVRVAALEKSTGAVGSVHYDLEVPDFTKGNLALSGVVLTAASARLTPTARADDQLKPLLPGPPLTSRRFTAGDELALFVDVYDNLTGTPHKVDISTTVRTTEGRQVFKSEEERASDELRGGRGAYGHAATIPLKGFAPGLYVLRVEARSRLQNAEPVFREVEFTIVGGGQSGAAAQ